MTIMKSKLCIIGVLVCATVAFATDIDAVLKRLDDIENREKGYVSLISELKQKLGDQDDRISQLENQLSAKDNTILKLDNRVADLCHDIDTIKERIANVASEKGSGSKSDDKKADGSTRNYIVKTDNSSRRVAEKTDLSVNQELQQTRSAMKKRFVIDSETPVVAFHAVLDGGELSHIGINQPIVFGTELLNLGGAYHKQHGIFIAPMKGVYVFSASIMSFVDPHPEVEAALVKNGNILAKIYGHGGKRLDQGSVTVTVQLEAADEIWVKNTAIADDSIYGARYDSFTGFLLAPL